MSEVCFVGTDVLLYFLTRENPERAEKCRSLLTRAANGLLTLEVTTLTVMELVDVLQKNYPRDAISSRLPGLLQIPGLLVHEREILLRALELYSRHTIPFRDAYQMAHVLSASSSTVYSYTPLFDQESEIQRIEP